MLYSLISAFLMYSRIPMPQIPWEEKNRRYALCFFPLIGAVIGGMLRGWYLLADKLSLPDAVFAVTASAIPLLITGGIHLDGFCDVEDACASCGDRPQKLQIMSDPHIGAFAVMRLVLYLLIQTGFLLLVRDSECAAVISCGFVLSRTLSGLAAVTFRCAKKVGTLQDFVKPAHRKVTVLTLTVTGILTAVGMVLLSPFAGAVGVCLGFAVFLYYKRFSERTFGGITGDTEGWFLQVCELWILIGCTLTRWLEGLEWF